MERVYIYLFSSFSPSAILSFLHFPRPTLLYHHPIRSIYHYKMRLQSLILLAMVATVTLAREDTAELCTGSLICDAEYCCSSQYVELEKSSATELLELTTTHALFLLFSGFCGRSPSHCSHSSGCNPDKGYCGVV